MSSETRIALSVVSPSGENIARGRKTIEVRSWRPSQVPLRDLLIIENRVFLSRELPCDPDGRVVAVVDVQSVGEWLETEVDAACSKGWRPGYWAWHLVNVRAVAPRVAVPAQLGLYEVQVPGQVLFAGDSVDMRPTVGPRN